MAGRADSASRQKVLARLMKRTAQADWQAFGMLYSMTSPQLFGLMLSMTDYANTCEDLLQEVYLTVWKKAGDYQPDKARVTTGPTSAIKILLCSPAWTISVRSSVVPSCWPISMATPMQNWRSA